MIARDSEFGAEPEQLQRFLDATRRGVEAAIELFFERFPEVREEDPELLDAIADATIQYFTPELRQDLAMCQELVEFCDELALSESEVAVEEFADQRFVE